MDIYIGNLTYETIESEIRSVFELFGRVQQVKIIRSEETGVSKGYGFVKMLNQVEAEFAVNGITKINGKRITINFAR